MKRTHKSISAETRKAWDDFIHLCLHTQDHKILIQLFELFFTTEERYDLATRYLIIKNLISNELTQREMAAKFNVSIAKITRGSNELKRTQTRLIKHLEKMMLT